jgi:hypothetical protein
MKKVLILMLAVLLLTGCAKDTAQTGSGDLQDATNDDGKTSDKAEGDETGEAGEGFSFLANDVTIPMNVDAAPIIEALGEADSYFEAASCAFQGLDKIYTYSGFEIYTYPNGDKDYISSVYLKDDSVQTDKGIYIGSTFDEVKEAYGEDYTEKSGEYTYTLGQTKLSFLIEEDCVSAITYSAIVEGLHD